MRKNIMRGACNIDNEQGFTLIELIIIIVILGILAVVAMPKYQDMQTEARNAAANGVYGGAQGAVNINHAAKLVGKTTTNITTGTTLLAAMDGTPDGWTVDDTGAAGAVGICVGSGASCDVAAATYSVIISTLETATAKAVLSKGGTVSGW